MIRALYKQSLQQKGLKVVWILIVFLALNYLLLLGFMNVCFQNLVPGQPIYLTAICIIFLAIDLFIYIFITKKILIVDNILDIIVIIGLALSFALYKQFKQMVYLQILALIKLKDIFLVNQMIYQIVKKYNIIFKTYVIIKIVYWIIIVGHIIGCLFYALDDYLIRIQYFGSISQNPNLYYQGMLHAYSPIYQFPQQWRYVYAIYYSFSLLSTVAFGDIIGHNYFQDLCVGVYLIISTICISLIIQQMFIVFRKQKSRYYDLITNIKYASQFIKSQPDITNDFRHQIINYMISSQWKQITSIPKLHLLTQKLQQSIFQQSILSRNNQNFPQFIKKFYLPLLKAKYYPSNYLIIDYNKLQNHIFGTIVLNAKVNIGYTKDLIGKTYIKKQCMNFGFNELILNNNYLNRYLTVELSQQAQVFTVSDDQFYAKIKQQKGELNQFLASPIQYYQQSKDYITFNTQQSQQCLVCKIQGHTLVKCNKFHLNLNRKEKYLQQTKNWNNQRKFTPRKRIKSLKNTSNKSLQQYQNQMKNIKQFDFTIFKKVFQHTNFVQSVLQKTIEQTLNKFSQNTYSKYSQPYQVYFKWKMYCPEGQIQN